MEIVYKAIVLCWSALSLSRPSASPARDAVLKFEGSSNLLCSLESCSCRHLRDMCDAICLPFCPVDARSLLYYHSLWACTSETIPVLVWSKRALFKKLRAKTMVFILMNALLVDTRRKWCILSSELHSVRSLRRFLSVGTERSCSIARERRSSISINRFLHKLMSDKLAREVSTSWVFTQLKKKCLQKLVLSSGLAHCNARAASCYGKSIPQL